MDGEAIVVREAAPEDVPALLSLWEEFMGHHAALDPHYRTGAGAAENFARWIRERIDSDKGLLLVGEAGGRAVAYLLAAEDERPPVFDDRRFGMIYDLAVTASHRRRGIGARLVDRAMAWFASRGLDRIELGTLTANEAAVSFWEKHGFSVYMERRYRKI